jgi:hypothetical protein
MTPRAAAPLYTERQRRSDEHQVGGRARRSRVVAEPGDVDNGEDDPLDREHIGRALRPVALRRQQSRHPGLVQFRLRLVRNFGLQGTVSQQVNAGSS